LARNAQKEFLIGQKFISGWLQVLPTVILYVYLLLLPFEVNKDYKKPRMSVCVCVCVCGLQLCITLNNISHVSGYLGKLSSLLHWDIVAQQLSIKHEDDAVGQTALECLASVVAATQDDVREKSRVLSQQIVEKIVVDLRKYTVALTRCHYDLPGVRVHSYFIFTSPHLTAPNLTS